MYHFHTNTPESFYFLSRGWDVRKAKVLLAARKAMPERISVEEAVGMLPFIRIQEELVDVADTEFPVIISPVKDSGIVTYMIIDGWHRVARARQDKLETLPAFVLTEKEAEQVAL